jgi:hypothetical protein
MATPATSIIAIPWCLGNRPELIDPAYDSSPSIGSPDIESVVGEMRQVGVPVLRDL